MNILKIVNILLLGMSVYFGLKHGVAMILAKPEMLAMFSKWDIGKTGVQIFGLAGVLATICLFFPETFFLGNLITACLLLFLTALCLNQQDIKGALAEIPFAILPLVMIYLKYPFIETRACN